MSETVVIYMMLGAMVGIGWAFFHRINDEEDDS